MTNFFSDNVESSSKSKKQPLPKSLHKMNKEIESYCKVTKKHEVQPERKVLTRQDGSFN